MKRVFLLIFLLMFFALWVNVPALMAMGSNKGKTPQKTQSQQSTLPILEPIQITIPVGTLFKVQLNQSIRASIHRNGQSFFATLKEPIMLGGKTLIPEGIPLLGVISRSVESGHFSGMALIELQLVRIIMPNETTYLLTTEPFQKTGRAHLLRNIGLIGGGAILGAGAGILFGQISGALVGMGLGAGTGAVFAYVTGKEDLFLKAGTELLFKLSRPITISFNPPSIEKK
jgi:hypothetical protein